MTEIATLVAALRERDIKLWAEDGRLKCSAPAGMLDATLRAAMSDRKDELLAYLAKAETLKQSSAGIVPIKPGGSKPPIFAVSGHGGDVFYLLGLARRLDAEQPMFSVRPPGLDGGAKLTSVEALASYEIEQIRQCRPEGPYLIAGHCAGGTIAFEVARQLVASGEEVALLALIGSPFPAMFRLVPMTLFRLGRLIKALTTGPWAERISYVSSKLRDRHRPPAAVADDVHTSLAIRRQVERATIAAVRAYEPQLYDGELDLFVTADVWHKAQRWVTSARTSHEHDFRNFEVDSLLLGPDVSTLSSALQALADTRCEASRSKVAASPQLSNLQQAAA